MADVVEQGPWLNFGLLLGDGEPTSDNVVVLTEEIFRSLPDEMLSLRCTREDMTETERAFVWRMLNRDGPPPRMRIVISRRAIETATERVRAQEAEEAEAKRPLVDRVQERLDSYTTNKQRRQRIRALAALVADNDGYAEIAWLMERVALQMRFKEKRKVTAREVQGIIYGLVRAGEVPLTVSINGEHVVVPQEMIDRSPPPTD